MKERAAGKKKTRGLKVSTASVNKKPGGILKAASAVREAAESSSGGTGRSLERILLGALSALSRRGATLLSMQEVCEAAGVSRATLYRYFSCKEDLLAAVGEYVSQNFVSGVAKAGEGAATPAEHLRRVMEFTSRYTMDVKAERILEIEPAFVLKFLQTHFNQHVAAFSKALKPVFDDAEQQLGIKLNRLMLSELLLRAQESMSLVPGGPSWLALPRLLPAMLDQLYSIKGRARR